MNIELRHLRYFIAVAEELHFGRAAARLNISQPPLSQQIQYLEEQIGARLLARTNRSVSLTAAGTQFLSDARQIVNQVNLAAKRAERLHLGETGELRIGMTASVPFIKPLSDTLSLYRKRFPDVHMQTVESHTRQLIVPLSEGSLDLGLMRNTPLPETLAWHVALREPLLAMVPHDHPLAARAQLSLLELANEPFVFFDPLAGTGFYDDLLGLLQRYGITPYVTQEVGEAMTIMGLVAAGLGVSILPASYSRLHLEEICWIPLIEEDAISEMWLVWAKHRELSAAARQFIELLSNVTCKLETASVSAVAVPPTP